MQTQHHATQAAQAMRQARYARNQRKRYQAECALLRRASLRHMPTESVRVYLLQYRDQRGEYLAAMRELLAAQRSAQFIAELHLQCCT